MCHVMSSVMSSDELQRCSLNAQISCQMSGHVKCEMSCVFLLGQSLLHSAESRLGINHKTPRPGEPGGGRLAGCSGRPAGLRMVIWPGA